MLFVPRQVKKSRQNLVGSVANKPLFNDHVASAQDEGSKSVDGIHNAQDDYEDALHRNSSNMSLNATERQLHQGMNEKAD
jgi:hypothetical protein